MLPLTPIFPCNTADAKSVESRRPKATAQTLAAHADASVPGGRDSNAGRAPRVAGLISVCSICRRRLDALKFPTGPALITAAENHSHGICRDCAPAWCQKLGLDQAATVRVLSKFPPLAPSIH